MLISLSTKSTYCLLVIIYDITQNSLGIELGSSRFKSNSRLRYITDTNIMKNVLLSYFSTKYALFVAFNVDFVIK